MKIDITLTTGLPDIAAAARQAESDGYAGVWTFEGPHDPFLPLLLAAEHTDHVELGTSIAVAFARNPMLLANLGWDLQAYSRGRFILGLGTQIRPHITKRFSMPWSHPAARMRDMVLATRAIWDAWLTGGRLAYRGEFYTHTLMTPFFAPAATDLGEFGPPRIFLAGVGALMTEVAGEVADGFLCHPLSSPRYLEEVTLPALARGRAKVGKTMDGFELQHSPFVLVAETDDELEAARVATRNQIAFYGSTPAYWPVLELHGWGDVGRELNALTKRGDWGSIGGLITDEMLDVFAIGGTPSEANAELQRRFGGAVQRLAFNTPYRNRPDLMRPLLETFAR